MFNYLIKRNFYKFGKSEIFENLLPFRSDSYFLNLLKTRQTFYLGIDPTANSLQIGNLFPLIALLRMWKCGHNIIALVGGATGKIGDPTDRTVDREQIPDILINSNIDNISNNINCIIRNFKSHYLTNEDIGEFKLLNNEEWYQNENLLNFLTKILKQFRFHDMKNKRSFEGRLASENTINMSEFLYPFLQAYDWLYLYRNHNCKIQIGGDDQQGNMQLGQILIERMEKNKVYGLTVPLFTVEGVKVGKSNSNPHLQLWLSPDSQSPYSLYNSIFHVSNGIILNNGLLKRLTLLDDSDIEEIITRHKANPTLNILQTVVAGEVLKLVYGPDILYTVKCAHKLFSTSIPDLIHQQLNALNDSKIFWNNIVNIPNISVSGNSISIRDLVAATKMKSDSNISNVKFNGENISDHSQSINKSILQQKIYGVLQIGSSHKWIVHLRH